MKLFWKNCKKPYFWEFLGAFWHANVARLLFWCHNKCAESKSTYTSIMKQEIKYTYGSVLDKTRKKTYFLQLRQFWACLGRVLDFSVPQHMRQIINHISLCYHAKNQKNLMKRFWVNWEKPYFWAFLGAFGRGNVARLLFSKIRLCHFFAIMAPYHHAKNQKKPLSGFRENAVTREWTVMNL